MQLPHFLTAVATVFANFHGQSTVFAQIEGPMSNLPTCALEAAESTTEEGNCTQFDFTCVCKASNLWVQYIEGITAGGIVSCNQTESQVALEWGKSFCAGLNITVSASPATTKTVVATKAVTVTTAKTVATAPTSTSTTETVISDGNAIAYIGMEMGMAVVAVMAFAL